MTNPILQAVGKTSPNQTDLGPLKNMMNTVKNARNPQVMLMNMAQQNPNVKQAMDFIHQFGGDPKTAFYKMAEQKGVDPESILSQLR